MQKGFYPFASSLISKASVLLGRQRMIPHSRPSLEQEELEAVAQVLRSGQVSQGPCVDRFERAMAAYLGRKGAVTVSSGTAALELALRALGVKAGDQVIMPSYVCAALWLATTRAGAEPRLVDIQPDTFNLDPDLVGKAITSRTRAVLVPHLFGLPADLARLRQFDVPLIEDCAQTLAASVQGIRVGTVGAVTVCSFYATKLLCTGEGGMVLADDEEILERARAWREYDRRPALVRGSFNYKMTDLQAAMGLRQLERVPTFLARRASIAASYQKMLSGLDLVHPTPPDRWTHIYYRYVLRLPSLQGADGALAALLSRLERRGVQCRRPVFQPLHQHLGLEGYPQSAEAHDRAMSVPIYPSLSEEDVARVTRALIEELS